MATRIEPAPIRLEVVVKAAPEAAFDDFFLRMQDWSPREHSLSGGLRRALVVEPFAGGRWYEVGENGTECDWGRVVAWDRPRRALLLWQIGSDFVFRAALETEVEVTFTPLEDGRTRVAFEHRGLGALGAGARAARDAMAGDDGWAGALSAYKSMIDGRT
jgi:uncharacterized protein YndB with AHSA1/START domain